MNDLVKCSRCKKTLIAESFRGHDCSPPIRDIKTIAVDYLGEAKDEFGREMILAHCMDGTFLRLVKNDKESIPIPFNPSDDLLQPGKSESSNDKYTEPLVRLFKYLGLPN